MTFLAIILALTLAATATCDDPSFTGSQISIKDDLLRDYNYAMLNKLAKRILTFEYDDIEESQKVWIFDFVMEMVDFTLTSSAFNFEGATHMLQNNVLTLSANGSYRAAFSYKLYMTLDGAHLISGTGTANVVSDTLIYTQQYFPDHTQTNLTLSLKTSNVDVSGGMFTTMFSDAIEQVVSAAIKNSVNANITTEFRNAAAALDADFLSKYRNLEIVFPDHKTSIVNTLSNAVTYPTQWESYFMSGSAEISSEGCKWQASTPSPVVTIDPMGKKEVYCVNSGMFPTVLAVESLCGHTKDMVTLSEWGLYGKAVELYEIVPKLADNYEAADLFVIQRNVLPTVAVVASDPFTVEVIKSYTFTMSKDSKAAFTLTTVFTVVLSPACETAECKSLVTLETAVTPKTYLYDVNIDALGKSRIKRFMQYEATKMLNTALFTPGIPVPAAYTSTSNANAKITTAAGAFCVNH